MMRPHSLVRGHLRRRSTGFSLIEVMVALIIISIGLLGIAKLQAVVLSSTGSAGKRSIGAIAAASIASAMHADRAYWSGVASNAPTIVQGASILSSPDLASGGPDCSAVVCTPVQMASYDLTQWAVSTQTLLSAYTATIVCPVPLAAPGSGLPNSCTITLDWTENISAANAQGVVAAGPITVLRPTYVLYVQP
jgi:type IV pilus assembly protein PilV